MSQGPTIRSRTPRTGGAPAATGGIQPRGIQPVHAAPQENVGRGGIQAARPAAGTTGYAAIKEQQQREEQAALRKAQERIDAYMPPDFFLSSPTKQGVRQEDLSANIVILDAEPAFAIHEHSFPNPSTGRFGKGSFKTICLAGEGPCPACDVDQREAYYALKLTVIDMRPYTNERTGQRFPHTRKIMTVKQRNQPWFFQQYERHGTLRGMQVLMTRRDPNGAQHGDPEFIDLHPEELIIQSFAHDEVWTEERPGFPARKIKDENADCYPFDYAKLFPQLTYAELAQQVGVAPSQGYGSGGYGGGHDSAWGADAQQFSRIQPRSPGIGMAAGRGGIQPRGAISNRMVGDAEDQQYDGEIDDTVPWQGEGGYREGSEDDVPEQTRHQANESAPAPTIRSRPARGGGAAARPTGNGATDPSHVPL